MDAQLEGRTQPGTGRIDAPEDVESSSLDEGGGSGEDDIAAMAAAAIDGTGSPEQPAGGPAPTPVTNSVGISNENDFDAVSNRRSIEEDAALVQQNQAQYTQVAPQPLPSRPSDSVEHRGIRALEHEPRRRAGVQPRRLRLQGARATQLHGLRLGRPCAGGLPSAGGPERDSEGLDPDGDGFACGWDPAPFRRSRG